MPAPASSTVTWATTLSVWVAFVPPAAALGARRFRRDPVGQIAVCWLAMAILGFLQLARVLGWIPRGLPLGYVATTTFPLFLVPPSLTWIGRRAKRWQWPILAGWCALCVAAYVTFPTTREFRAVMSPLMALVMTTLSGMALASRVHLGRDPVRQADWFWILTAHVVYFTSDILRQPLLEALVASHYAALDWVADGLMLLYVGVYLMVGYGMLLREDAGTPPPPSVPPSAPSRSSETRLPQLV